MAERAARTAGRVERAEPSGAVVALAASGAAGALRAIVATQCIEGATRNRGCRKRWTLAASGISPSPPKRGPGNSREWVHSGSRILTSLSLRTVSGCLYIWRLASAQRIRPVVMEVQVGSVVRVSTAAAGESQ